MRISKMSAASGLFATLLLTGCGGTDDPPPGTLTTDEEAAARQEMQAVEDAEKAHFGQANTR